MTNQISEQDFIEAIKQKFDKGVDNLDAATLSRLNSIRADVLESAGNKSRHGFLIPVGAMAAGMLAVLVFILARPDTSSTFMTEDIEMFSSSEGIEFYENLEFYQWLEEYDIST